MVQDFLEDVAPLISMQLGGPTLDGLAQLFEKYIGMLMRAVPLAPEVEDGVENEDLDARNVRIAEAEAQQGALLGNAAALANELLRRAAVTLAPGYQLIKEEPGGRRVSERQAVLLLQDYQTKRIGGDGCRELWISCRQKRHVPGSVTFVSYGGMCQCGGQPSIGEGQAGSFAA